MDMYKINTNVIDIHTASLMKRLHSHFDEISLNAEHQVSIFDPMFKLRTLNLIAEIYAYVNVFFANRSGRLSDYFNECTLKQCLKWVIEVEEFQQSFYKYFQDSKDDNDFDDTKNDSDEMSVCVNNSIIDDYKNLYVNGIKELCKDDQGKEIPSVCNSSLWNARQYTDTTYSFKRIFRKAKEELDEKDRGSKFSLDPEDRGYNESIKNNLLSRKIAYKVVNSTHNPFNYTCSVNYNFMDYINAIHQEAEKATIDDIYVDFFKALEFLRNTFMTDAEDIYYIRTGDFEALKKNYSEETIENFYTHLPFKAYYYARKLYIEDLEDELIVKLEDWRRKKGYVCRKITKEEHVLFLKECKEEVENRMMKYEDLWELRMHSGGLDSEITANNFARMFYRRQGVVRYFIELQWELEMLQDLIKKQEESLWVNDESTTLPEVKAVETFTNIIIQLVNEAYNKWNNQRVSLGANKPEAHIVIQREELIKHIQEKKKNSFEELKDVCYPESGKTKLNVCRYIVQLQKENYFGKLPSKELARILAPIVGLTEGTVTNYLSQT